MKTPMTDIIRRHGGLVIDGAMSTALESHGCDLADELWSAKILIEKPDVIRTVHLDYFRAGAQAAITASYQASAAGFAKKGLDEKEAYRLCCDSVKLAREARETYLKEASGVRADDLIVCGAIGPYGAYLANGAEYRGDYDLTDDEYAEFHRVRLHALIDSGADVLAIETQPKLKEVLALLDAIKGKDITCWVSFTLKDAAHISDGTSLSEVARVLDANAQVEAIGLNCVKREQVADALHALRERTQKPLLVYPNSGETYDPATKTWHNPPVGSPDWTHFVPLWKRLGAVCLGGCCRTLPRDIVQIAELVSAKV